MSQTLAAFLTRALERTSSRELATRTGISHTNIQRMARGDRKMLPEIETLQGIATAFELPLYRVMEMAGVDLGIPDDAAGAEVRRIAALGRQITADLAQLIRHIQALGG